MEFRNYILLNTIREATLPLIGLSLKYKLTGYYLSDRN